MNQTNDIILSGPEAQNPALVYIRSLHSPVSQAVQRDALNVIARKLMGIVEVEHHKDGAGANDYLLYDWTQLRYEHMTGIQSWLLSDAEEGGHYKPASARRYIAAIKGVLKAAKRMKLISGDDYYNAIDLPQIAGESTAGRMLSPEEVVTLFATCATGGPTGAARDAAILMIMVLYTARRAEITSIQYSDYIPEYKPGIAKLTLHGKGRKDRVEFISNGEREIMADWIKIRGTEPGPMFFVVLKSDEIVRRPLKPITIYQMVLRRMHRAGIQNASPHDLRRTAISNLLDLADATTVAKICGHTGTNLLMKYDKRKEERMIEALAKLHLPFRSSDRKVGVA
jgi:integrase